MSTEETLAEIEESAGRGLLMRLDGDDSPAWVEAAGESAEVSMAWSITRHLAVLRWTSLNGHELPDIVRVGVSGRGVGVTLWRFDWTTLDVGRQTVTMRRMA